MCICINSCYHLLVDFAFSIFMGINALMYELKPSRKGPKLQNKKCEGSMQQILKFKGTIQYIEMKFEGSILQTKVLRAK